jgi:hypothetical protein
MNAMKSISLLRIRHHLTVVLGILALGLSSGLAFAANFLDVSPNSWAFGYISAISDAGITAGCGGGNYCPTAIVTREQMAAFIVRAVEGEPTVACTTAPFSDVPASSAMCKYIKRVAELGISAGCGGSNYCPSQNVTREQMAAFIVRAVEGEPTITCTTAPFSDVPISDSMCKYIKRVAELGITTGCGGTNYCPGQSVTRDQMAAFLARAFNLAIPNPAPWVVFNAASYPPTVPASTCTGCKTYYVDGTSGSDSNTGLTTALALKTIAKSVPLVKAGDTVLIRKGLYREGINMTNHASGSAGKPITFGSYGDGEVILDGSTKVTWTLSSGTVSTASPGFTPIGVVANEVPLKQTTSVANVTAGSGRWYYGGGVLTADLGTTSPNTADVVVPKSADAQEHVYFYNNDYLTFKGLTIRGSGAGGVWGYGNNITIESCVIKFNGKSAVSFQTAGGKNNQVLTSHIYHNVLTNWPRGNNGYASAGGGWPGTVIWWANQNPVARGNIVHMNGGEGLLTYGTQAGVTSGNALFEQNIVYDNWSVNIYVDNKVNGVFRNNFIFDHPPNTADYINNDASLAKFSVCMMLADEYNSSDGTNNHANLSGTQVYNNIFAGCRIGIRDYSEGTPTIQYHGLKNTVIANNTIIMPHDATPYNNAGTNIFGIYLQNNGSNNSNTNIQNNIVYGFTGDPLVFSEYAGAITGVKLNYNDYYSGSGTNMFGYGPSWTSATWATWKSKTGADANSKYADPLLTDVTQFRAAGTGQYDYNNANLRGGSPALGAGTPQTAFGFNFLGATRSTWNIGAY